MATATREKNFFSMLGQYGSSNENATLKFFRHNFTSVFYLHWSEQKLKSISSHAKFTGEWLVAFWDNRTSFAAAITIKGKNFS